jgi:hypothetical protein
MLLVVKHIINTRGIASMSNNTKRRIDIRARRGAYSKMINSKAVIIRFGEKAVGI